ncbi:unnamed protein product [Cochlearia groenlandica]
MRNLGMDINEVTRTESTQQHVHQDSHLDHEGGNNEDTQEPEPETYDDQRGHGDQREEPETQEEYQGEPEDTQATEETVHQEVHDQAAPVVPRRSTRIKQPSSNWKTPESTSTVML